MRALTGMMAGLAVVLAASPAFGFIERIYTLEEVLKESTHVLVGKVTEVDAKKQTAVARIERPLKGKKDFANVQMNLSLGPADQRGYLMTKVKKGQPIILFYKLEERNIACCVHTGDTWFQLFATDEPQSRDKVWWRFSHLEIYLGRTFNGTTPGLIKLTGDVLAGRVKPPPADPTVPKLDYSIRQPKRVQVPPGQTGGFKRQLAIPLPGGEVRAISAVDVNGDERLDLYACRGEGNALLINGGKAFEETSTTAKLKFGSRSASFVDYNGDGHPDLLCNDFLLFTQVGGQFRDDRKMLPQPRQRNTEGAGWIDYDGDGLPDVLITSGEHGIVLLRNTGKDTERFQDVSDKAGFGDKGLGVGNGDFVVFADFTGDGYTDLLYNLNSGVLAINNGDGTFSAADKKAGIDLPGGNSHKRGVAVADYDNDGDLDLFVPSPNRPRLYRNNNDGTFTDVFAECGDPIKEEDPCVAAAWGDVDCDGNLDIFICHSNGSSRLYLGDGKGHFRDISDAAGVRTISPSFGAVLADLDGDGDLDLAANLADRVVVAFNDMGPAKGRAALSIRLASARGVVGATVRVSDEKDRPLAMRELSGADGPGGMSSPIAHFGLPVGAKVVVSAALTDGRLARRTLTVDKKGNQLVLRDEEFK